MRSPPSAWVGVVLLLVGAGSAASYLPAVGPAPLRFRSPPAPPPPDFALPPLQMVDAPSTNVPLPTASNASPVQVVTRVEAWPDFWQPFWDQLYGTNFAGTPLGPPSGADPALLANQSYSNLFTPALLMRFLSLRTNTPSPDTAVLLPPKVFEPALPPSLPPSSTATYTQSPP